MSWGFGIWAFWFLRRCEETRAADVAFEKLCRTVVLIFCPIRGLSAYQPNEVDDICKGMLRSPCQWLNDATRSQHTWRHAKLLLHLAWNTNLLPDFQKVQLTRRWRRSQRLFWGCWAVLFCKNLLRRMRIQTQRRIFISSFRAWIWLFDTFGGQIVMNLQKLILAENMQETLSKLLRTDEEKELVVTSVCKDIVMTCICCKCCSWWSRINQFEASGPRFGATWMVKLWSLSHETSSQTTRIMWYGGRFFSTDMRGCLLEAERISHKWTEIPDVSWKQRVHRQQQSAGDSEEAMVRSMRSLPPWLLWLCVGGWAARLAALMWLKITGETGGWNMV